ncbi:hypothetical protein HN873_014953, partial [Arachis hypogaea]
SCRARGRKTRERGRSRAAAAVQRRFIGARGVTMSSGSPLSSSPLRALLWLATWYPGRSWDEDWDKLEDKGLRDKKCVPCNLKELRPMAKDAAHTLMPHGF